MRAVILLSWAAAFISAAPTPQDIDFDAVLALPTQVQGPAVTATKQLPIYNPSAAASSAAAAVIAEAADNSDNDAVSKRAAIARDACAAQPKGYAPATSPDTDAAFLANANYSQIAHAAGIPQGYQQVFSNLQASVSQNGYMGISTMQTYNTILCQQTCDAAAGCMAFNMYIERDPVLDPGTACPNPASTAVYKCVLWGLPISSLTATNAGQWRGPADANGTAFHIVIAASNGYVKNTAPPPQTNFTGPVSLGGAIQAPLSSTGQNTYLGFKMYGGPYDPGLCAAACQATTAANRAAASNGTYAPCNFFNSYVLALNNAAKGTYCTLYTQTWGPSVATNLGQYDQSGNWYTVSSSYGYTLTDLDTGVVGQ